MPERAALGRTPKKFQLDYGSPTGFGRMVRMNRKQRFIEAVRLMAPKNHFVLQTAQLVSEEDLPPIVGVAAFELAATLDTLQKSWRFRIPLSPAKPGVGKEAKRATRANYR